MTAPTNLGPDWLLQQLAEMRKAVDSSGFRIGTVISYSGGNIAVQIGTPTSGSSAGQSSAASGTVLNAAYISKHGGYLPVAGDQVLIAKIGASWVVLGTFGNILGGDPYIDIIPPNVTDGRAGHITTFASGGSPTAEVSIINATTRQVDGGRLWVYPGGASLNWAATGNNPAPGYRVDSNGLYLDGLQWSFTTNPTTAQWASGQSGQAAGVTSLAYSYGSTMNNNLYPLYAVAQVRTTHAILAASATGATVGWSDTSAAHTIWLFGHRASV